jgi:hypothetical protein
MAMREMHGAARYPVHVGRAYFAVAGGAQSPKMLVVREKKQDVWALIVVQSCHEYPLRMRNEREFPPPERDACRVCDFRAGAQPSIAAKRQSAENSKM